MKDRCENAISVEVLADYWAAALPMSEEERVEEHLLACDSCGDRLREIMSLGLAIRSVARAGDLRVIVSQEFLDRAAKEGLRIRQYAPPNGGSVDCTIMQDDDLLVGRLAADVSKARRLDLRYTDPGGTRRIADIPFNPQTPELLLNVNAVHMRTMPAHIAKVELISIEEDGERVVGEYTFNHSPSQ